MLIPILFLGLGFGIRFHDAWTLQDRIYSCGIVYHFSVSYGMSLEEWHFKNIIILLLFQTKQKI